MIDYDFSTLNDKEFENISIDLLSIEQKKRFERFKPGRDAGVDGRYFSDDGKEEIIQCKHYLKTGYRGLIAKLKSEEVAKVKKLKPKKYFLVTSLPLSRNNKQEIKELFTPYIKKDSDVYGQEDLNDLLKKNPDVEERHYKLWLSSSTVLKRILNNAIKGRSEFLLEEIKEKAKYYVMTQNHIEAQKKLEESHTIIIAGEPGIGKTTLAEHLALLYVGQEFEFCVIENSINEAENIFDKEKKQLFYFDDFLGSNYLEALEFHQDSHIVQFMKRVKKDKNKRFILTSRTNIFNQSLLLSDTFKTGKIDKDEFVIKIDNLSEIEKAKILYNHIWHSHLNERYIDELYKEKRYKDIIKHKNFNPRLIEFITDIDRLENIREDEYWEFIGQKLNNPADIWTQTFDHGSDEFVRNIVALTVFNGNTIDEQTLTQSYEQINRRTKLQNFSYASKDFDSVIKSVIKYFLNRNKTYREAIEYSLFNPSIADFVINRYKNDTQKLLLIFLSLNTVSSLKVLFSLYKNEKASEEVFHKILIELYNELEIDDFSNKEKNNFAIQLFWFLETTKLEEKYDESKKILFFEKAIHESISFSQIYEFLNLITKLLDNEKILIESFHFLIPIIEDIDDIYELNLVIELLKDFDICDETIIGSLNESVRQYLIYALDSMMSDLTCSDVAFSSDMEGGFYVMTDLDDLMEDFLGDVFNEIEEFKLITIDKFSIMDNIDTLYIEENLVNSYIESFYDEDVSYGKQSTNYTNDIEDLFER